MGPETPPPPVSGQSSLWSGLDIPPWRIEYVGSTPSTNALATIEPYAGRVVLTDHQTAGRGRLDRTWETPAGQALTFSATIDPMAPDRAWPLIPLIAGLAVTEALPIASLKWPNDVMVEDRKLAGILVQRIESTPRPLAIVGIGLNVHQTDLPIAQATSLHRLGLAEPRADILRRILAEFAWWLDLWGDGEDVVAAYRERCSTIGRQVRVELPDGSTLSGTAESVTDDGRLVVAGQVVGVGDVVHIRMPR